MWSFLISRTIRRITNTSNNYSLPYNFIFNPKRFLNTLRRRIQKQQTPTKNNNNNNVNNNTTNNNGNNNNINNNIADNITTPKKKWRNRLAALTVLLGGAGTYAIQDEGNSRAFHFWKGILPIYAHYRFVQWKTDGKSAAEIHNEFSYLHDKYANTVKDLTLKLRGFYLKQAQLMSILDDFVPPQYMVWCKQMQDQVPTEFAPGQARQIVEKSFGKPISQLFQFWDDNPLGAASIGQVHRAILLDGREVAVKVQFPGIENKFRSDLKTIKKFCAFALPQHVPPLQEIEEQFLTEFDYVAEAKNLESVCMHVMPAWKDKVAIPLPILEFCTKDVLTMEYLNGVKLDTGVRESFKEYAASQGTTLEALEADQKRRVAAGELKSVTTEKYKIRLFRLFTFLKDIFSNSLRIVVSQTFGKIFSAMKWEVKWSRPPVNLAEIMETLYGVHAYEFFVNGEFNGDPHPGNILLMDDGRLGLVDYGQVKKVPLSTRLAYAELILAIEQDDKDKIVDIVTNTMNNKGKYNKKEIAYKLAVFWNDRFDKAVTNGMNIAEFLDWAESQDPVVHVNRDYVMIARVSVLLRGMGNAFGLDLRTAKYFKPYAEKLLAQYKHSNQLQL